MMKKKVPKEKKLSKKISVETGTYGQGLLRATCKDGSVSNMNIPQMEKVVGEVPRVDYVVTYTVRPYGKYRVGHENIIHKKHTVMVCWLPSTWKHKRVSRTVKIPKKKGGD